MVQPVATAAAAALALSSVEAAQAARSGGRMGGRVSGGGGGRGGGGGGYRGGGGPTNVYIAPPPLFSPFGFGFSPFGFSPFGFGFGFGLPAPLLLLAVGGLALTSFRSSRGIEQGAEDTAGAALCLQVACYCSDRSDSLYGRLQRVARTADTESYEGLQQLTSDVCLALLRSSKDWLAARSVSSTAGVFSNDVEEAYNRLVVQERAKWQDEQTSLKRTMAGQPTYMVATLVVLLRSGQELPGISGVGDLREAVAQLASTVSVEDNLIAAEVLWTPEDTNDVMDRDDMFLNFPELVTL